MWRNKVQPGSPQMTKSGNLNFLEPSGPLQACNGPDLPVPLPSQLSAASIKCKKRENVVNNKKEINVGKKRPKKKKNMEYKKKRGRKEM